ncbi:MAG: alpha/beta hydrolase [Sandaracinaceae bacterium]|nr:alpha/beta hydrolase [Sandaracinaceae bacterium]
MATLAHTIVRAEGKTPTRSLLFLHGILGTRANWRGIARRLVDERPELSVVLVDVRGHGDSLGMPGPSTIEQAARDLRALEAVLETPVRGALGHSFGGKVAMQYALDRADPLDTLFVIDSSPGREVRPGGRARDAAHPGDGPHPPHPAPAALPDGHPRGLRRGHRGCRAQPADRALAGHEPAAHGRWAP